MKIILLLKPAIITILLSNSFDVFADTISGKIEFLKKAPFTGIVFVANTGAKDKAPVVNQKDKMFTTKIAVGSPSNTMTFKIRL